MDNFQHDIDNFRRYTNNFRRDTEILQPRSWLWLTFSNTFQQLTKFNDIFPHFPTKFRHFPTNFRHFPTNFRHFPTWYRQFPTFSDKFPTFSDKFPTFSDMISTFSDATFQHVESSNNEACDRVSESAHQREDGCWKNCTVQTLILRG